MTTPLEPAPGTFLTEKQAQRAECLRLCFDLCTGRSVMTDFIWEMARWVYDGSLRDEP